MSATQQGPTEFASSVNGTPAVTATGTNGADGVDASSDSGTGVSASSKSGTALVATSSSGLAGHFVGNVGMDNNLKVAGALSTGTLSTGTLSSGAGSFASGVSSTPAVTASGTSGAVGVHGISDRGLAGLFDGDILVNGNFLVTGVKNFVQAHPTDPGMEIVYVALEGGEAGTYVRGSGQLQNGKAVIALPEHFGLVTEISGLTIQLTPRGEWLQLYVVELDTAQLVVREAQGKSGAFDYFICGLRKGYEQHEVIRTKY